MKVGERFSRCRGLNCSRCVRAIGESKKIEFEYVL